MATNAMLGYTTQIFYADSTSPGVFTQVAEAYEVTPPNAQADDVDVTHYASPNRTREYIQGLIEPGEASFSCNRVPGGTTETAILNLQTNGTKVTWRFIWPNGTMWEFPGYVKGYETTAPVDDKMTATTTLKVTGSTTITIGSPTPP